MCLYNLTISNFHGWTPWWLFLNVLVYIFGALLRKFIFIPTNWLVESWPRFKNRRLETFFQGRICQPFEGWEVPLGLLGYKRLLKWKEYNPPIHSIFVSYSPFTNHCWCLMNLFFGQVLTVPIATSKLNCQRNVCPHSNTGCLHYRFLKRFRIGRKYRKWNGEGSFLQI